MVYSARANRHPSICVSLIDVGPALGFDIFPALETAFADPGCYSVDIRLGEDVKTGPIYRTVTRTEFEQEALYRGVDRLNLPIRKES